MPRVHGARSPVPPRVPLFATTQSVRYLATLDAGSYPLCYPPNAWSPGVPALPGPCYWPVASGTPLGWSGGCLAAGLVRSAVPHYCLGGCSALFLCVRRSRQVRRGGAVPALLPPPFLVPPALALPALRVVGFPVRLSLSFACWYATPHGLCLPQARLGCPSSSYGVPVACV